jgi:hypothetical protein
VEHLGRGWLHPFDIFINVEVIGREQSLLKQSARINVALCGNQERQEGA